MTTKEPHRWPAGPRAVTPWLMDDGAARWRGETDEMPCAFTVLHDGGRVIAHDLGTFEDAKAGAGLHGLFGGPDSDREAFGVVFIDVTTGERHAFPVLGDDAPPLFCYCGHSQHSHYAKGCDADCHLGCDEGDDCTDEACEGGPCVFFNWSEEFDMREMVDMEDDPDTLRPVNGEAPTRRKH